MKVYKAGAFHRLSIGRRNCVGKGVGLLEARLVVVKLLWNLDVLPAKKIGTGRPARSLIPCGTGGLCM